MFGLPTPAPTPRACCLRAVTVGLASMALACLPAPRYAGRALSAEPSAEPPSSSSALLSAHMSRFGDEPPAAAELAGPRLADAPESSQDRMVLVFDRELDALSVDPRAFAILRGDGRRVRPVRALLAPAQESDENRSLTLLGNFGAVASPPVAVHVIGRLHDEAGGDLSGLDAAISAVDQPDRVVVAERREPAPGRCPQAAQVVRLYWTDTLAGVSLEDLAQIELNLADGRTVAPGGFDDQRGASAPPASPAPAGAMMPMPMPMGRAGQRDDNVLDLCVDQAAPVVHLRIPAGVFEDEDAHPSAAADVNLNPPPPPTR